MKKYSLYILVLLVAALIGGYFTELHSDEKTAAISEFKEKFIKETFSKKRTEFEKTFTLLYQSIRTIGLLPSVRKISGGNRHDEKEDVVAQGRFSQEGALTVQQLYNNLVSNVNVSEVYAVLNGFDHSKGDIPFFMYDKVLLSEADKSEEKKEPKTSDTPEESEESEYQYFPHMLQSFKEKSQVFDTTKGLDGVIPISSSLMRTCDNDQYKSLKNGHVHDAEGFVFAVPFYGLDNHLKGAITAIIRANVLEAQLLGVPKLVVTEQDQEEYAKKPWDIPQQPVLFSLVNMQGHVYINDRRANLSDSTKNEILGLIESSQQSESLHYEKLNISDHTDWYLVYDFRGLPWRQHLASIDKSFQIRLGVLTLITSLILVFLYSQNVRVNKALQDVFVKLSQISSKISSAGHDAEANGAELSSVGKKLATATDEMAAAIGEIEAKALSTTEVAKQSQMTSENLNSEILVSQKYVESLQEQMTKISQSNEKVRELVSAIDEINKKTKRIEDIVFKTQLLSFNASIEAARAGDAGRGFSVVSEEVGLLAQAIKQAAQETSAIILENQERAVRIAEENSDCVGKGNESVAHISQTVSEISKAAGDLNKAMENISQSSLHQFAGIKQISATILEVQKVMENNSRLAQTSLTLASSLKLQTGQQTEAMVQISDTFGLTHQSVNPTEKAS